MTYVTLENSKVTRKRGTKLSTLVRGLVVATSVVFYFGFLPFLTDVEAYFGFETSGRPTLPALVTYTGALAAIILYLVFAYLLTFRSNLSSILRNGQLLWMCLAPVFASLLSLLVSPDPVFALNTLRSYVLWSTIPLTILFLWSEPDQLVYFIRTSLLIALLVSIAGIFLIPERALHQISEATTLERAFAGLWKGGWAHKNQAGGSIMFLAAISAALFWLEKKWWILVIFILSSIFLWNSNSITAIVAVPLGLLPLFGMLALHRWPLLSNLYSAVLTLTFIGFPFLVVGYLYPEYGFDFSQRSFIWQSVIRYTDLHPILGGGYASVFTIPNGIKYFDSAYFLRVIGHAHSGVMEAYSQLGWVGLAILATMVFMAQTSLAQLLRTESVEQKPYVQILTWCFYLGLIRCVTEPDFLNPRANTVMFLLLMMAPTFMLFRMKAGQTSPLKLLNRLGPAGNQD